VVGHLEYYPRFGFSSDLAVKFASPFKGPHFMALELLEGALSGQSSLVTYPDAFGLKA
jgi:putative acetyltransferase